MVATTTEAAIWQRMIDADPAQLSAEAAKALLKFDFAPSDRRRMEELSRRVQGGQLSLAEQEELQTYVRAGHVLALIQSKARRAIKTGPGSSAGSSPASSQTSS
jgi:hypothetical protein